MRARCKALLPLAALAGALLSATVAAAEPATLIYAGRVFDSEGGRMLGPRLILVQDGRIAEIGTAIAVPPGTRRIDLRAYTVLPGLIESHAHLLMDASAPPAAAGESLRALRGAGHARRYLEAGYTSVRNLGKAGRYADVALKRAIEEGSVPGPRLFVSGPALAPGAAGGDERNVRRADDARAAVREHAREGVDLIRIDANGVDEATMSLEEMQAAVGEARAAKLKVTAYATSDAAIARALEAGVDAIEHGEAASNDTLHRMRQESVPMVPLQPFGERLRQARAAGVTLAAGSDAGAQPQRGDAARRALLAWVEAGLAPRDILQAATINGARLLGVPGLGVIEAGAHADIIAVQGDPMVDLEALTRVVFVMKGGQPVRAPTP
ncbi:amidohydrolase family protein [Massilia sp. BKSP1R2A-1]|uniref:amidohydrolase family protein n=1 Tax=Massilia sp. BKSP1R2A-1 TaxID=3422595 RepID=UPI003D348DD6